MKRNRISVVLDEAYEHLGYAKGQEISFTDGLPTVDDGLAFYISQLAGLEATIYQSKYTAINFQEMVPLVGGIPEWADSWDYISYDAVTVGKFIGSSADDLPNVALSANHTKVPIGYAGNMFDYSLDELRKSQQLRMPVDTLKARAAFRGALEHTQRVAYFGDKDRGMTGLFNNPNIALDNSTLDWDTATGMDIYNDMNELLINVWMNSANTHLPNAFALDSERYAKISTTFMSADFPNKTILQHFKESNLYTTQTGQDIRVFPRLQLTPEVLAANGVENGGKARMMAYELNDENLGMANPLPWRALAPQLRGLNVEVPCEYKASGVGVRYLFSAAYRDAA